MSLAITSCNFNANISSDNREQDKNDAEEITSLMYAYLENKDFEKAHAFFSPRFFEVTPQKKLDEIFITSDKQLGTVKTRNLIKWETRVKSGTNSSSEYLLVYNVIREKFNSTEMIRLEKEKNEIKIIAYNVQSDGFIK